MISERLRVTSIPHMNGKSIIINGTPLTEQLLIKDVKYRVSIFAIIDDLPAMPEKGDVWEVVGAAKIERIDVNDHTITQHSFSNFKSLKCIMPNDSESLLQFIAQHPRFKGIGITYARRAQKVLNGRMHDALKKRKEADVDALRTVLSDNQIDSLYEGYAKFKNLSESDFLSKIGIPFRIQNRLFQFHNEKSLEAVKLNPYLFLSFGMKFHEVDRIATQHFNCTLDDDNRLLAAVERAMQVQIRLGHSYCTKNDILKLLNNNLNSTELAEKAMLLASKNAKFAINKNNNNLHPVSLLFQESVIAKRLIKLSKKRVDSESSIINAYNKAINQLPKNIVLNVEQEDAIKNSLSHHVSAITGGAGTGKTTVLRTVLQAYKIRNFKIHAVALSGRAAMRLYESINLPTMTIARFLNTKPIDPSLLQKENLLVIDESSMVDLDSMYQIVKHLHPSVRILFTGDPSQLPPVTAGRVLADIVKSKRIINTKLKIVKRQEGSTFIPEYSSMINQGIIPPEKTVGSITFHECAHDDIAAVCSNLFLHRIDSSKVIAPTRALVSKINNMCQSGANEHGKRLEFNLYGDKLYDDYRVGDPVLFINNNYDVGYQNGSLGVLKDVKDDLLGIGYVEMDDGSGIELTTDILSDMQLGYCMTLHKAQGSQFPRIVIALSPSQVVDRAWLYTAITRAEKEVHIVGKSSDFDNFVKTESQTDRRNSYLCDLLNTVDANAYESVIALSSKDGIR